MLNAFIEMDTKLSGPRSLGFILDDSCGDGLEGAECRKWKDLMLDGKKRGEAQGMAVLWEHREGGHDNRSVASRRRPTPVSLLASTASSAMQPSHCLLRNPLLCQSLRN